MIVLGLVLAGLGLVALGFAAVSNSFPRAEGGAFLAGIILMIMGLFLAFF